MVHFVQSVSIKLQELQQIGMNTSDLPYTWSLCVTHHLPNRSLAALLVPGPRAQSPLVHVDHLAAWRFGTHRGALSTNWLICTAAMFLQGCRHVSLMWCSTSGAVQHSTLLGCWASVLERRSSMALETSNTLNEFTKSVQIRGFAQEKVNSLA